MLFDALWKFGFSSIHKRTRTAQQERRLRLRFSRLGFERLEERTLLSGTSGDSLALSWITPLAGQTFTMNVSINPASAGWLAAYGHADTFRSRHDAGERQ